MKLHHGADRTEGPGAAMSRNPHDVPRLRDALGVYHCVKRAANLRSSSDRPDQLQQQLPFGSTAQLEAREG